MTDCLLCASNSHERLFSGSFGSVFKCADCGLVYLKGIGQEGLKDIYSSGYFLDREEYFFKDGVVDTGGRESAHVKDFREGLEWLSLYVRPPGRLLDVGCATGSFISIAKEKGWTVSGAEISDYAASVARQRTGIEVHDGLLKDSPWPGVFFDAVTMWDVVEHLNDPLGELRNIRRLLKDNGFLLLNTPNEASLMRRIARALYSLSRGIIKSPIERLYHNFHLYYFDDKTAAMLLEKAGFSIVSSRKKVIPITRGRGSMFVKFIVRILSIFERLSGSEYELFFIARKR
ncbi:MAG: class I SAM-dependent methyltransferase [Deltaproteobacteria bacterium]|nr:class I SAM-dependent methyltransferase [Deltaproteobacteria bacterium]